MVVALVDVLKFSSSKVTGPAKYQLTNFKRNLSKISDLTKHVNGVGHLVGVVNYLEVYIATLYLFP